MVPMKVGVARESAPGERRVALVPEALGKLEGCGPAGIPDGDRDDLQRGPR